MRFSLEKSRQGAMKVKYRNCTAISYMQNSSEIKDCKKPRVLVMSL